MYSASGHMTTLRKRLFTAFGLAVATAFALMLPSSTRGIGAGLALALVPMSVAGVGYLIWLSTRTAQPTSKRDLQPSRGVLLDVPTTWRAAAGYLSLYLGIAGLSLWAVVEGFPGDAPENAVQIAMGGAVLLQAMTVSGLAELLSAVVARRWGTTPPGRITAGLMALTVIVGLAVGLPLGWRLVEYMSVVRDFGGSIEVTVWSTPVVLVVIVAATWIRHSLVSEWQHRLDLQAHYTREAQHGRKLAEAQLAMMQAQIEPHFLYNTLASVQYLVRHDAAAADSLLTQLVRYLRHAMPKLRRPMSTLQQEFELADAYLQIARMRMGGRLTTKVELPDSLHDVPFPPLILQTLVENALKHGVEPKAGPVRIEVCARVSVDTGAPRLALEVKDDGVGLGRANTAGTGTGLASVRERLSAIYGGTAELVVADCMPAGVTSSVALRLRPGAAAQACSASHAELAS